MKQRFLLVATLIFAVLFLGSCKRSGINDPVDPAESESSEAKAYASEINFAGWDIAVAGGIDDTLRALLAEHCSGYSATGTSGTELFLLGAYSSTYDSQIEAVLDGGGACVLTENLNDEKNIAAFLKACGFTIGDSYAKDITDLDDLEMLGIHADGGVYFAYNHIYTDEETAASVSTETVEGETGETPDEPEDIEFKNPEEKLYSTWQYAALLGAYKWYSDILADEKAIKDANTNQPANAPLRAPRKAEGQSQSKDIEEIIKGCPYTITMSHTYRRLYAPEHSGRPQQDAIENVTLSVIAKYNMRQIFVFQSPNVGHSGGDYYVVNADLEWVNSGMYKGVGQMDHGKSVNRRYCGFIPHFCTMQTTPIVAKGYTIEIPAGGSVLPETVNRKTDHSESRSFSIGFGATGGGGRGGFNDSIMGNSKFNQGDGAVSLNAGWGWNNTKSYPKYDWYIVKDAGSPNAGHTVRMDDDWLPQPTFSDPGFEKVRENYGSTITVHESWIWHIPETKTDSTNAPLKIKFSMKAQYTWMDHFKYPTTRMTDRYKFGFPPPGPMPGVVAEKYFPKFEKVIPILPTNRVAVGSIKVTNNMVDDKDNALTVSNVTLVDADSKNNKILYADTENIYAYGTELTYTLPTKYKYRVYFKAGVKANTAKWYRMHKPYSIGLGQTVSISDLYYVADDVAEGEWHPAN